VAQGDHSAPANWSAIAMQMHADACSYACMGYLHPTETVQSQLKKLSLAELTWSTVAGASS